VGGSAETQTKLKAMARDGNKLQRAYAKSRLGAAEGLKNRTYDFRNVGGVGKKWGIGEGIKNYGDAVEERKKKLEAKQKVQMKKYGYDDLAKTDDAKREILAATASRDNHQADLKTAEQDYNSAVRVDTRGMSDAARQAHESDLASKQEILRIAQETMENYEMEVGRKKNIGMQKHYDKMEKKWAHKLTPVRRDALEKMKKEMEKKFKEDGKAKQTKKRSGSGNPPPTP
jgi:hypothetical protein